VHTEEIVGFMKAGACVRTAGALLPFEAAADSR